MFLHLSVRHAIHRGSPRQRPPRHRSPWTETPWTETLPVRQRMGGMHPTGIHSCLN